MRRGGEDGAARADDDLDVAPRDPPPMFVPFDVAQVAVQHGHAIEPGAKPADRLRREADLRHEQNCLPAKADNFFDRLDVDFGFAAAGDAVNENRAMLCGLQRLANRGQALALDRDSAQARLSSCGDGLRPVDRC